MMESSIPFQHNQYLNSADIESAKKFLNTHIDKREIISLSSNKHGNNIINMQALGKTLAFGVHWKDKVHITSDSLSTFHIVMPIAHSVENKVSKIRAYEGDVLICSPKKCVDLIWDKGCRALVATIDIHALKHYFQIDACRSRDHGTQVIRAKERTSQSLNSLFTCLSQQHAIYNGKLDMQMQKHFESMLMGSLSDQILTNDIRILPTRVKIAVDWIRSDLHRPFDITELIALCCCSRRSLENGFRQYIGMTPAKYVLCQKLTAINNLLKKSSTVPVGDLAFRFGFNSPSHCTKLYKNYFGETPSETLSNRTSIIVSSFQNSCTN
jgi:AraC-like DNA-binding protein